LAICRTSIIIEGSLPFALSMFINNMFADGKFNMVLGVVYLSYYATLVSECFTNEEWGAMFGYSKWETNDEVGETFRPSPKGQSPIFHTLCSEYLI